MSDTGALVTDVLEIWTSAIERKSSSGRGSSKNINLYGIDCLRALIMDFAVCGKLVEQDSSDEPASRLLDAIAAERAHLIANKKISKPKKLEPISVDELSVPKSWVVARFGNIFSLEYGDNLPEKKRSGTGEFDVYGSNGVVGSHEKCSVNAPCLVVGRKGSAGAINKALNPCWVTDVAYSCIPPKGVDLHFQYILFRTLRLDGLGKGIKPGLSRNEVNALAIPLPPLAEQKRIVAKVDELMSLCDALERESEGALTAHQTLVESLLATLTTSTDAVDLAKNWARLETHFDTLLTTEASIDALKQTILDLAVRGKLVPQNEGDESAEDLLRKLSVERASRGTESRSKATKGARPLAREDHIFSVPRGWTWVRLGDLTELITSGSRDWSKYLSSDGAKFVTMGNLSRGSYELRLEKMHYVQIGNDREGTRTSLKSGDLLVSITGDVGNLALIPDNFGEAYINQHTAMVRFLPTVRGRFLPEVLRSPMAQRQFSEPQRGVKNSFRLSDIQDIVLPLPPLAEQQRIVAKVDELMSLCEKLKDRLADAAQTQRHLADAITKQAAA